ncbi:MAG: hypothetical protein EOP89_16230 [Lysobacteraceae bacterium]|nr:MAG: hypothetical protein EOP89_16230 [Xanthomonadaceae bacterium]
MGEFEIWPRHHLGATILSTIAQSCGMNIQATGRMQTEQDADIQHFGAVSRPCSRPVTVSGESKICAAADAQISRGAE